MLGQPSFHVEHHTTSWQIIDVIGTNCPLICEMKTNTQCPPRDFHGFSARDRYFIEIFAEKTVVINPIASRMDHGMGFTA
jgi:hypothetical protein